MIKYILIAFTALVTGFSSGIVYSITQATETCPSGSYAIGDGVCKAEPTGCPYGDSIPLNSEKCVPTTEKEIEAYKPIEPIEITVEEKPIVKTEVCK